MTAIFGFFTLSPAFAAPLDYKDFALIPVQQEGRIKPLNTFASIYLERFHGSAHMGDSPAIAWLANTMFDPASALDTPLFLIKDVEVQGMLELLSHPGDFYSFSEVMQAMANKQEMMQALLKRAPDELSSGQHAAVALYENAGLYHQIMMSCTLVLKMSLDLPEGALPISESRQDAFIDYYKYFPGWEQQVKDIVRKKGSDPAKYTESEIRLAEAAHRMSVARDGSTDNTLLRVIPPQWQGNDEWLAPWAVFHSGQGSPESARLMELWRTLAAAYQGHDNDRWIQTAQSLRGAVQAVSGVHANALSLEVLYYRYNPIGKAILFYMLGFVLTLLCLTALPALRRARPLAISATAIGAALHFTGIAARVYVLQRPPVGTLYESLLFVSLIGVLFSLYLELRLRNTLGILAATVTGSVLLFLSQSFGEGDTMSMLIAVLNTNFWLVTHVLCITTGYSFGIIASVIAHVHLVMRCANRDHDRTRRVLRGGYATALIALLFASLGTILGGIWADQSWGRFWGWDPKENGAMMICLWLIWLLHGRISSRMHERGFAVGLALLNVVIALSWLGVNLLSVGLHSYGFTDKAAYGLGAFCAAEFAFAAITYTILWRRDRAATH